jgi:hypothetical protein
MKKTYLLVGTILLIGIVATLDCFARQPEVEQIPPRLDSDYYKMFPLEKHQKKFPLGHPRENKKPGKKCYYSERDSKYFCQF